MKNELVTIYDTFSKIQCNLPIKSTGGLSFAKSKSSFTFITVAVMLCTQDAACWMQDQGRRRQDTEPSCPMATSSKVSKKYGMGPLP